jgi:hypothetical protein
MTRRTRVLQPLESRRRRKELEPGGIGGTPLDSMPSGLNSFVGTLGAPRGLLGMSKGTIAAGDLLHRCRKRRLDEAGVRRFDPIAASFFR